MRCPECQKFASYGEPEVDVVDFPDEADEGEALTAEVQVSLTCNDCGGALKEATLEAQATIDHTCDVAQVVTTLLESNEPDKVGTDDVDKAVADRTFDVDGCTADSLERAEGKSKRFYGASVVWTVTCNACRAQFDVDAEVEEQSSAFEEVA